MSLRHPSNCRRVAGKPICQSLWSVRGTTTTIGARGYPMHTNAGLQMAMSEVRLSSAVRYNASFTPALTFAPNADSSGNANALTLTALPGGTLPVWFAD